MTNGECQRLYEWRCKTYFSLVPQPWIWCACFTGLGCNSDFLLSAQFDGFKDSKWHFKHENIPTWICTKSCLFSSFWLKWTLLLVQAHDVPADLKTRSIFWTRNNFTSNFFHLHSTFLPIFFCSQSSISLNCIWNYRSSYHSLKRLVCPALCILAVLSNPLVWTPVSLHFPH